MKGREGKGVAAASADLLVCFPSRAHLSLMPKPICSPARRPSDHNNRHRHIYPHHRRNNSTGPPHASPSLLWIKNSKQASRTEEMDEPTSPKVTCAGQIKVRPTRSSACRNWQSVMEEIERIHNHGKQKKKTTWADSLGFKKEILQFLTCLRSVRFDFRCFGSFPHQDTIASDEEDGEEEEDDEDETQVEGAAGGEGSEEGSTTVFSKWFMVLQDNKGRNCEDRAMEEPAVPPPNALLLMRCRSAPAQSRLQQSQEEVEEDDEKAAQQVADEDHHHQQQQKKKKRESLAMVMKYDTDFDRLSPDIAKETWVVSGLMDDPLSRSRSWKRW